MSETNTCDVCGRSVTITTERGEYVTGLRGYRYSDGSVRCEGNTHGPHGACVTMRDGETVLLEGDE